MLADDDDIDGLERWYGRDGLLYYGLVIVTDEGYDPYNKPYEIRRPKNARRHPSR